MYLIIQKCGSAGKKLFFFIFMFSFILVPFNCLAESVDRWTSSEHSEKNQPHIYFIQKCGLADKKLSFYFLFSFLPCTLQNHVKKCEHK